MKQHNAAVQEESNQKIQRLEELIDGQTIKINAGGIAFTAQRNSIYSSIGTAIPYEIQVLNIGNALNLNSGVFTVPTSGRYYITFNAISNSGALRVFLRLNGANTAVSYADGPLYMTPIMVTLNLEQGDRVDVLLDLGSTRDSATEIFTSFSGFLLEEDLPI